MSSIPSSAMPHAKAHEKPDTKPEQAAKNEDAPSIATTVTEAVRSHPKTAVAVGATILAGAAAAIAAPLLRKDEPKPKRKPAKKKN